MSNTNLLNETHNPALLSWLDSANQADTDFPIQNLPFAVFKRANNKEAFRGGVAIGDQVIDLTALGNSNVFNGIAQDALKACSAPQLNDYMSMGKATWSALRLALSNALKAGSTLREKVEACLIDQADVEFALPCNIGDYTDFYTSIHHATSVGLKFSKIIRELKDTQGAVKK